MPKLISASDPRRAHLLTRQGLEFDTVVLADDFINLEALRCKLHPAFGSLWNKAADAEEVRSVHTQTVPFLIWSRYFRGKKSGKILI